MSADARRNVLVIEDDDTLQSLLGKVLTKSGFSTATVTNARDAQPLFGKQVFDAMICDLSAADGSNVFDFVRSARSSQPRLAVLLITGFTPEDVAGKAKTLGVEVLEKPFSPPQLVERITLMLRRKVA